MATKIATNIAMATMLSSSHSHVRRSLVQKTDHFQHPCFSLTFQVVLAMSLLRPAFLMKVLVYFVCRIPKDFQWNSRYILSVCRTRLVWSICARPHSLPNATTIFVVSPEPNVDFKGVLFVWHCDWCHCDIAVFNAKYRTMQMQVLDSENANTSIGQSNQSLKIVHCTKCRNN